MKFWCILVIVTFAEAFNETDKGNGKSYFFKMKQNSSDFIITSRIPNLGQKDLEYPVIQKKLTNDTAANQESAKNLNKDIADILDQIETENATTKNTIISSRIPLLGPNQLEYPIIQKKTTYQTTVTEEPQNITEYFDRIFNETESETPKSIVEALIGRNIQELIIPGEKVTNKIDQKVVDEFVEKATIFAQKCSEETKATSDDVAEIMAHKIPTTQEGKCMISCVYKALGIQNADGTLNEEKGLELISVIKESDPEIHAKFESMIEVCKNTPVDEDPCTTAVNFADCFVKESKKVGVSLEMLGIN